MELCLRIPAYVLLSGGTDRAVERAAFSDVLPEPIKRRQNKAAVATTLMAKIRESLPFLSGLLHDGILVKEGILDRSALTPYITGRPLKSDHLWPFLSAIAAEVWARKWSEAGWRLE